MPRRVYTYPDGMGWNEYNLAQTIGSFIIALSVLVFIYNAVHSMRHGQIAGNDPWDARTLEWSIPSPPPHYNFAEIPVVTAMDDWWHTKYGHGEHAEEHAAGHAPPAMAGGAEEHGAHAEHAEEHHEVHVHMPDPSYFPIVVAAGMFIAGLGMITNFWICLPGVLTVIAGIYGWSFEPVNAPDRSASAAGH
jgi:cytochrome c oxidase subunit 1